VETFKENNMDKELSYWLALAHVPKVKTKRKNEIVVRLFEQGKSVIDFFHSEQLNWKNEYDLTDSETQLFKEAFSELSNYAFMVEDLLEQGYNILPITSKEYSPTLKKNLGRSYAPPVIYTKGNLQIMKEKSIAIVGSRKANDISLTFTDNVAKKASEEYKVIVSGFAKGVDKQALDSALKYKGQSIIVLPQGISTFKSGFKKYYKQIIEGDVLVLSTFYPKAPWSVQLAMARNPIIYGLASEIYVAESSDKGGTWSGVMDGLRKGRTIYVRKPNPREKNANGLLISKGAKAVDDLGNISEYSVKENQSSVVSEPEAESNGTESRIIELLQNGAFDSKSIVEKLKIDWTARKVTSYLKKQDEIETINSKPLKFTHKHRMKSNQTTLF
jgi:DNA protecting protein DprA